MEIRKLVLSLFSLSGEQDWKWKIYDRTDRGLS